MRRVARSIRTFLLLVLSPLMVICAAAALALTDLAWLIFGKKRAPRDAPCRTDAASVVIPNWNGRDLLERYLPPLIEALAGHPDNEVIVVDNGSSDGSAEFVRRTFPQVRVLALDRNLGFGGGSNAGFRAAQNDIVVLLNSDMRVAPDFLAPLLEGFSDPQVFAVSCQIFFADPARRREETGLTEGWWENGKLKVRHRDDPAVSGLFPCFYGGGGSCAFDRRKFLELAGFDELLAPFYLEDTDLGFQSWKRGWKVLYQARSVVYHEHRGTIGKRFSEAQIQAVLKKNYLLFCWKNVHEWPRLTSNFFFAYGGALVSLVSGDVPGRANLDAWWRAFRQLPGAVRSRWRARALAVVSDTEAFRRPRGGWFRDEALARTSDRRGEQPLRVLFVSPYPICPPVHGGGVFMYQTLRELTRHCEVHVVGLLDDASQLPAQEELREVCASVEWRVRPPGLVNSMGSLLPHAVHEFRNAELEWLIDRQLYLKSIEVLQLEYTPLGQYARPFRNIAVALFEHDIYFQSVARGLEYMRRPLAKMKARFEYLRSLRWELRMLRGCDQVQVCTRENRGYLSSFEPALDGRLRDGLRAGIDTAHYAFRPGGREPHTMLFVGSFRHDPNRVGLEWFIHEVLPRIAARRPEARLVVVGSDAPERPAWAGSPSAIEILGFVEDIREVLSRYAVFICPVLSGSGVRVKLLEAFAGGIPVVSTYVGAEGLSKIDGDVCRLADAPAQFADRVIEILENPCQAAEMATRARTLVEANWDMAAITARLAESYRECLRQKQARATS